MNELYISEEEPSEDVWIPLIYKLSTTLVGASVYVYVYVYVGVRL